MNQLAVSNRLRRMVRAVEVTIKAQLDLLQQELDDHLIDQNTYDLCRNRFESDLRELQTKVLSITHN